GAFVAKHERCLCWPVAARGMKIAVTHARGLHFDEHFTRPRHVEHRRLDRQRLVLLPENRGLDVHATVAAQRPREAAARGCPASTAWNVASAMSTSSV